MLINLYLIGGVFLGWSRGRNNLSNLFGAAIFTRMVQPKTATFIAIVFVVLGAVFGGSGTTSSMLELARVHTMLDAFIISISAGLVLWGMTYRGIPVSIAQATVGSVVAWSIFYNAPGNAYQLQKIVLAWIYSPFLAALVAFVVFKIMRVGLRRYPMPLLYKDLFMRAGLIVMGAFSAYALGANNVASISAPYFLASSLSPLFITILVCISIGAGFLHADTKVIKTMGSGLFPLSPMEALIVVFSGALTLFLFSWNGLRLFLGQYGLPSFPMVPIPISSATIGAIVGVSLAKGGYGLKVSMLGNIAVSWTASPVISGLICWGILTIVSFMGGL